MKVHDRRIQIDKYFFFISLFNYLSIYHIFAFVVSPQKKKIFLQLRNNNVVASFNKHLEDPFHPPFGCLLDNHFVYITIFSY